MSTASAPAQPTRRPSLLARHPLVSYYLIDFVFSWLMFLPAVLSYYGVLSLGDQLVGYLAIAGLLGPILSGFVMSADTEGWRTFATCCAGSCCGG
jgi:hypothetical protein